jgi:alpha-galactosidase
MIFLRANIAIVLIAFLCTVSAGQEKTRTHAPPNASATVLVKDSTIEIHYDNTLIFTGLMKSDGATIHQRTQVYQDGNKIQQVVLLTTMDWNKKIRISGTLTGSSEAFPCEADRPTDRASQGPLIVRNASGLGRNLRNRAVYDRHADWVFSVDPNPKVIVTPAGEKEIGNSFSIDIEGYEIILRFRPHFYQNHRGLRFFEPWTYKVWPASVAGWISWFAFYDKVTEKDMVETADVFSSALGPFGYEYFQMDDGYQQGNGEPDLWLKPNEKFPNGLKYLADYIRGKGLKPGLWMGAGFFNGAFAAKHKEWFLRDRSGTLVTGNWIQYPLDASNAEAINGVVRPIFRGFRSQGWEYFKVDGLRHLRYEGYNANRDYFDRKKVDLVDAYRRYAIAAREEIGRDRFMLGCWGIRPELVGIIDGCRIGDDGFSFAGLSQYNSFNNVVWRNDPDHIELNDGAYRSTMVTSLTGSLLMLTDKPAVYRTSIIEPAKRAVPVLFTRPGQLYDVDPSRSSALDRVDVEVSGSGPRPFDAGYVPQCHLYSLEINRPYGSWIVLGRTGGDFDRVSFADLGLSTDREYLVFEFWTKSLTGVFNEGFDPGKISPKYNCQLFCIRERENHPQIVATSRHVSCGGYDLKDLSWIGKTMQGTSEIVGKDAYTLYVFEPAGSEYKGIECNGARVTSTVRRGVIREITLLADTSAVVTWKLLY